MYEQHNYSESLYVLAQVRKALVGVEHHTDALKPEYRYPDSLLRQVAAARAEIEAYFEKGTKHE